MYIFFIAHSLQFSGPGFDFYFYSFFCRDYDNIMNMKLLEIENLNIFLESYAKTDYHNDRFKYIGIHFYCTFILYDKCSTQMQVIKSCFIITHTERIYHLYLYLCKLYQSGALISQCQTKLFLPQSMYKLDIMLENRKQQHFEQFIPQSYFSLKLYRVSQIESSNIHFLKSIQK